MIPEQFSIAGLKILIEVLQRYSDHSLEFVHPIFERDNPYFQEIVRGASDLGIVRVTDGELVPSSRLDRAFRPGPETGISRDQINNLVLECVLASRGSVGDQVTSLAQQFEFADAQYRWRPKISEIPLFVGLRNVLLEVGVIEFDPTEHCYVVSDLFIDQFIKLDKQRHWSLEELRVASEARSEIGTKAELVVVDFERKALEQFVELASKVTHVAADNAAAGFDVLSYERSPIETSYKIERFIEVKAVSIVDWRFHWTRNEVETAKEIGGQYYLYLVPVLCQGMPSVLDMKVIRDPYERVFANDHQWAKTCDSFQVWEKEKS